MEEGRIKAKTCLLIRNDGKLLVHEVLSKHRGNIIRPPGGSIEYGEFSRNAAKREMQEEIGAELENIKFLGSFENIFKDPGGDLYHELLFVYTANLKNKELYKKEKITAREKERAFYFFWVPIKDILNKKITFVPKGMEKLLKQAE